MDRTTFISLVLTAVGACVSCQYQFVQIKLKWTEAQRYCRDNYTDLITIKSMRDTQELMKSLNDNNLRYVWIGLQKTGSFKWRWSLVDPPFYTELDSQYLNWAKNESGADGDCVSMSQDGKWYKRSCTESRFFICYNDSSKDNILVKEAKTWRHAQSFCRQNHTDLASVKNQTQNEQFEKLMNDSVVSSLWMGLFRDSWAWSDQSNSSFRNWGTTEPNGLTTENCTLFSANLKGQWEDWPCNSSFSFVCLDDKLVLVQENLSWTEALTFCRENHVDLVSVQSEEIQRRVMNVAKKASTAEVWLGLHHYCKMNMWIWLRGEVVCYQNWAAGHGSGEEDCSDEGRSGAVRSGGDQRWVSLPQNRTLNFICTNTNDF